MDKKSFVTRHWIETSEGTYYSVYQSQNAKLERRKNENMSLTEQNSILQQENTELKSKVEELEKILGSDR